MGTPITTWTGNANGMEAPMSAMMALSGRTPLFAGDAGPRYTGPFNMTGSYGSALQVVMPQIMQAMMGSTHMPAQFIPEQNLYDQMEANRYLAASQQAMTIAAQRDARTMERVIGGITQTMTGKPLTELQQARNFKIAGGISSYMPLLAQVLGPDLIDQLHGSRGSATVFAQQFHQAMRTSVDPISRTTGMSGASAGQLTQEMFETLFGPKADLGILKGMSAGQAGIMVNELQVRGMLGRPIGTLPLQEQRAILNRDLSPDRINRLAEQLPEIRKIIDDGGTPNEADLDRARSTIKDTHAKLKDPQLQLSDADVAEMPGAQDIIRTGDADRISSRLKNLSGAVKAMRDIFGDMGNPNAPMREIINGLDALTQGGLATMTPGQLELMVRKTHNIARQTGIGMEGMIALTTQNASLADQLGLDRSFAVTAAQQAANFGAAAGDNLRLDIPTWGALSKEQLLLNDNQLRMHAAASPLANQLNAVMRMADTGMAAPAPGTELATLTDAIRKGQTTYEFEGRRRDIVMPHAQMIRMLQRDAGVDETSAYAVLNDITGNQEFGQLHNTTAIVRKTQVDETARRMLTPTIGNRLRGILAEKGVDELLTANNVVKDETEFRELMHRVGEGVGQDFLKLDGAVVRSTPKKRQALSDSFRQNFIKQVQAKAPGMDQATIENMFEQLGGDNAQAAMGTALQATINQVASSHPTFKSDVGLHNTLNLATIKQGEARERQTEITALNQSALASLGNTDPIRRLVDVFQAAKPETTLQEMLTDVMGGVSQDAIKAADPNGGLAKVFGLIKENNVLDPNDPAQLDRARQNAGIIKGIIEGGDTALEQLQALDTLREPVVLEKITPEQRQAALQRMDKVEATEQRLRKARAENEQTRLNAANKLLDDLQTKRAAADDAGTLNKNSLPAERQRVGTAISSLAADLGKEEIALGDNRFLTRQGIVTKDAEGKVKSTAKFSDADTATEALKVLQDRHDTTVQATVDAAKLPQDDAVRLKEAVKRGFVKGDLPSRNQALYDQLLQASKRGSDTSVLGELGYQLGATVSIDQVKAVTDSGDLAAKLLTEGKDKVETQSAVSTFTLGLRERSRQLLDDERSMKIIGHGGLDLVRGAMTSSEQLQALAAKQTAKLGRKVSVGELLQGGKGITPEVTQEATKTFQGMRDQWAEVDRRRGFLMLPGKGDNPANQARLPMTEQELEELSTQQNFTKEFQTAESRAANVVDRLVAIATPAQQTRMNVDVNRKKLIAAVAAGDRGVSIDRALYGRQELLEMGLKKGVFGNKTKFTQLTDEDEATVGDKLEALQLSETERNDVIRLRKQAAPFMDFGVDGMRPGDITQDALHRIQQSTTTQAPPTADAQDKSLNVTVTGNVSQRNDGTLDLNLEGQGIMNQVMRTLGMG